MLKYFIVLFISLCTVQSIFSQNRASGEQKNGKSFVETNPPAGDVRAIAEWEPAEAVIVRYPFGIPYDLIAEMSEDCIVTTIVANQSVQTTVLSAYNSHGVNTANCNFITAPTNSYWTRDYTAWYVATGNSEIAVVDFPYNRPREDDDEIPVYISQFLETDLYGMNVFQTGGNYMCDGYGAAAQTDLVEEENPALTSQQIAQKMHDYLGITDFQVTSDPLGEYIKHIDCWGKYLDVDKVLISQVPVSDDRYADYEAVAEFFASRNCSFGYPYQVFRVQSAASSSYDVNPYTNSLILNNKVFLPQTGSTLDDDAVEVYEQAMPGYEIIPVYELSSAPWENTDALHCRTHEIPDRNMVFIKHYPLFGTIQTTGNYTISAQIYQYGTSAKITNNPILHYQINEGIETEIEMTSSDQINFTAEIPAQPHGTSIQYYISAISDLGKTYYNPTIGASDPFIFNTEGSAQIIENIENTTEIKAFPNPCYGKFFVKTSGLNGKTQISLYDIVGKLVLQRQIGINSNLEYLPVEIENIRQGIYTLSIKNAQGTHIEKLIVN